MDRKLSTGQVIVVIAGLVALLGSFLPWIDIEGETANAWSDGLFPTYAWVGIFGAVMAAQVLLAAFSTVRTGGGFLGFSWPQIHLVLGFFALLIAVSFLIAGDEFGVGFFLSLFAAVALLVGARMMEQGPTTRRGDTTTTTTGL